MSYTFNSYSNCYVFAAVDYKWGNKQFKKGDLLATFERVSYKIGFNSMSKPISAVQNLSAYGHITPEMIMLENIKLAENVLDLCFTKEQQTQDVVLPTVEDIEFVDGVGYLPTENFVEKCFFTEYQQNFTIDNITHTITLETPENRILKTTLMVRRNVAVTLYDLVATSRPYVEIYLSTVGNANNNEREIIWHLPRASMQLIPWDMAPLDRDNQYVNITFNLISQNEVKNRVLVV